MVDSPVLLPVGAEKLLSRSIDRRRSRSGIPTALWPGTLRRPMAVTSRTAASARRRRALRSSLWAATRRGGPATVGRRHGRAVAVMAHHVGPMGTIFMEICFGCCFFLFIQLAVLVGIVFFQNFLLELGSFCFDCGAHGFFFLFIDATVFVGVELFHESSTMRVPMKGCSFTLEGWRRG